MRRGCRTVTNSVDFPCRPAACRWGPDITSGLLVRGTTPDMYRLLAFRIVPPAPDAYRFLVCTSCLCCQAYWEDYHNYGLWNPKVIFTIHNLNYGQKKIAEANQYCQRFTTVSPTYAFETGASRFPFFVLLFWCNPDSCRGLTGMRACMHLRMLLTTVS